MEKILKIVKEKYPNYKWFDEPCQIETIENDNDENFCMDIESVLEYTDNILDSSVEIEKEICFESEDDDVFCHVYTDKENNINRTLLNID
jgi:hypothetical protein